MKNLANLDPSEYLMILWRRRWYALATFALIMVGTAIYSYITPDVYQSNSMIMVEQAAIPQDYARSSERSSTEEQISGIRQQVRSRSFVERLIQEFQLYGYGNGGEFSMDAAVEALAKNINVTRNSSNTFQISAVATDARLAQTIVQRVVDSLIESSKSSRKTRAVEADQFVDEQLRQAEQKLLAQEEKIKQFKIAHLGELPEQSTANMNALNGLHTQLASVENALVSISEQQKQLDFRNEEQKKLNVLTQSMMELPVLSASSENKPEKAPASNPLLAAKQAELKELSLKYTANHPDVVRLARQVEELKRQAEASSSPELTPLGKEDEKPAAALSDDSILGSDSMADIEAAENKAQAEALKTQLAKREKEREALLAQIKTYQGRLNIAPALEQEYMGLSRDYERLKQEYSNLQSKKFQTELTTSLETRKDSDTYKVVDEANLPERPSFPDRKQIILLGLGAGFLLSIGAAFGREFLDSTLGSEDEAMAVLKLPVLVSISEIPQNEPRRIFGVRGKAKSA
jgi:polysaccharide chain length determinant protein (PEP-CTERM system associated)